MMELQIYFLQKLTFTENDALTNFYYKNLEPPGLIYGSYIASLAYYWKFVVRPCLSKLLGLAAMCS